MNQTQQKISDVVWERLREEVTRLAASEKLLANYLQVLVLRHERLENSLAQLLAAKLATPFLETPVLQKTFLETFEASADMRAAIRSDLAAVEDRDPAARGIVQPFLYFKGFHALQAYRVAHDLWLQNRQALALYLQSRISEVFGVDIHPAARVGQGILIDHGTSVVIGETAVVGDEVSILHEVTLGGTGKQTGDRHPKVGHGVLIGAGAKILGNISIGEGAKIAANSVVLKDVPPHSTAAGIPARIVGHPQTEEPSLSMDQNIELDYSI
jgi:serine O-acetyltransferase